MSSARNAGKVAFSDFEAQPSAEIVRVERAVYAGKVAISDFEVQPSAEIARVDRMILISKCNPLSEIVRVHRAKFLFVQSGRESSTSGPIKRS